MKGTLFGGIIWIMATAPTLALGQTGVVVATENIRATPNGVLLGRLEPGFEVISTEVRGDWVQFTLEGWVWERSLQTVSRRGFPLVVSAPGGENLRAAPSGEIVGFFQEGTLLEEVDRTTGWILVRRVVWIWTNSVDLTDTPAEPRPESETSAWRTTGASGGMILTTPDGDTLAHAFPGSEVQVLARQGNWARVRVEGWTWLPKDEEEFGEEAIDLELTPETVVDGADEYRGRVVQWNLEFISMEAAESVRTDFYEGEPFLLTRSVEGRETFVYVAIPPERKAELSGLSPLERIRVTGRIRTGAASFTGSPILDLLEVDRR